MEIFLDKMEKHFGKDTFRETKGWMYLKYKEGFYVNSKLGCDGYKFKSIEEFIGYLTMYRSGPAMAGAKISDYDDTKVTLHYSNHKRVEYREGTNSAYGFVTELLRHLLPKGFPLFVLGEIY